MNNSIEVAISDNTRISNTKWVVELMENNEFSQVDRGITNKII